MSNHSDKIGKAAQEKVIEHIDHAMLLLQAAKKSCKMIPSWDELELIGGYFEFVQSYILRANAWRGQMEIGLTRKGPSKAEREGTEIE